MYTDPNAIFMLLYGHIHKRIQNFGVYNILHWKIFVKINNKYDYYIFRYPNS